MFTDKEREIITFGKQNGKTRDEVAEAIQRFRTGRPYTVEAPNDRTSYSEQAAEAAEAGRATMRAGADRALNPESPADVVTGATKAAAGAIETVASPLAPLFSPVGKLIGYVSDKLSDTKLFKDFGTDTASLPADELTAPEKILDFVKDATTVGGAATGVKPTINAAASSLKAARQAVADVGEVGTAGIQKVGGTDPAASLMQRVARISKGKQSAFEQRAGESVGQYLVNRGIFGTPDTIVDQLYTRFQNSKKEADTALASLPGNFKNTAVGTMLKELEGRERSISSPGAVSRDMERVIALNKKMKGEGLTMSEINEVKRLYERNVKLEYMKDPSKLGQGVAQANNLDSAVRDWQLATARQLGLKNLDQINKETMLARQLADDLGAEYAGSQGNNLVSITDWITLSGGGAANAAMFLTKQALGSKTVMSKIAETMAGSTPKIAAPRAEMGAATIDNYLKFIERTEPKP